MNARRSPHRWPTREERRTLLVKSRLAAALLIAAVPSGALSGDSLGVDPYCKLFSREYLRVVYAHNVNLLNDPKLTDDQRNQADVYSDTAGLNYQYGLIFSQCVGSSQLPKLPDIPESTDKAWMVFMTNYYENKVLRVDATDVGQVAKVTASEPPPPVGEAGFPVGTPGWNAWCKKNYPQSFNEKDGTVILEIDNKGNRVRCPG
jgi:hypothetical protein